MIFWVCGLLSGGAMCDPRTRSVALTECEEINLTQIKDARSSTSVQC
jgi:hypothetical protein